MPEPTPLPQGMDRIEELVARIEGAADPSLRDDALALVQLLLDLHRQGLARIIEIAGHPDTSHSNGTAPNGTPPNGSGANGAASNGVGANGAAALIHRLAADERVAPLLMLHDLHPVDLPTRVEQALEKVRPLLRSHGGDVELVDLSDGIVKLKLDGSCHGCPSSSITLRNAIEEAIFEFAPDIDRLEVAGVVDPPPTSGFVPLEAIRVR
jgi:Fe-S cluster biogenesis protein NfuA